MIATEVTVKTDANGTETDETEETEAIEGIGRIEETVKETVVNGGDHDRPITVRDVITKTRILQVETTGRVKEKIDTQIDEKIANGTETEDPGAAMTTEDGTVTCSMTDVVEVVAAAAAVVVVAALEVETVLDEKIETSLQLKLKAEGTALPQRRESQHPILQM